MDAHYEMVMEYFKSSEDILTISIHQKPWPRNGDYLYEDNFISFL